VTSARRAAEVSATRQAAITEGFRRFPTFLAELRPTMARLNDLTNQQKPLLRDLRRAAPSLTTFLKELGPFTEASRPAFRSLGDLSTSGLRAVRDSSDEVRTLREFAKDAPAVGKPLRQFLQVADDRERTKHGPDKRAAETAPPAPDPTSNAQGKTFTGMESFWNYIFWQGTSTNEFDSFSHILRTTGYAGTECAPYITDARPIANGGNAKSQHLNELCNAYMGPYQPGVNACDVLDKDGVDNGCPGGRSSVKDGPVPAASSKSSGGLPKFNSLDPKAGQPQATTPLPGQLDPSKPHVVLPPQLQELMNQLQGTKAPSGSPSLPSGQSQPSAGSPSADQLLNFLMSP
jgi:hypothetical protein